MESRGDLLRKGAATQDLGSKARSRDSDVRPRGPGKDPDNKNWL